MTVKGENYSNQDTPSIIDTEYVRCNFSHTNCIDDGGIKKGNRLFPGDDTPRTFKDCNLTNCEPPPGSTLIRCPASLSEKMVHVSSKTITIDAVQIEIKSYANIIYGRYKDGAYEYKATPVVVPKKAPED